MINSFKGFLVEEEKTVYFTFGRMNPPTIGHEKLLNVLASKASKNPYRVFVSQSQDKKKNPLGYKEKVKVIRKMFPKYARNIMLNTSVKTAMDAASALYNEGYKNIVMVVGSDRMREFETLLTKYNGTKGRHGFYNFNRISVISAGERDPDAEGVEGMSASKMRDAASAGDFTKFSQGVPSTLNNADTKAIYNAVRKGMGLKESKEFTKHVQLESVSEIRESYVNGELFKEGDTVVIKETGELGKVKTLGSNYVIIEGSGNQYRKWLDAIEKVEEPKVDYDVADFSVKLESLSEATAQDPDIKDRKGTQPKRYHTGLSTSTKTKRDAHFKKHGKKSDDDSSAYQSAPGDKGSKTKPSKYTMKFKDMYGEACWDTHKQVGYKTKNGKSVPNCVPKEASSPAQQAAIAISKKERGEKPKNENIQLVKDKISREREIERRQDAADKKRQDSMMDRARSARTRRINRRTTSVG